MCSDLSSAQENQLHLLQSTYSLERNGSTYELVEGTGRESLWAIQILQIIPGYH